VRRETFSTDGPIRLDVDVPAGIVRVEATQTHEAEVELEALASASEELLDQVRVSFFGGVLVVDAPERDGFRRPRFGVRIRCPHGSRATIRTRSAEVVGDGSFAEASVSSTAGDIDWHEIAGDGEFNVVTGRLRVARVGGRLDLNTVSGDAVVGEVGGPLRVHAVSADVTVDVAAGPVKVETVSGDLELRAVVTGEIELGSVSGDLRVGVKRGSVLRVDATAVSGELESAIDLSGAEEVAEEGPFVDLRARTISGDLRIARA
jgi:DUF4097 and DUF4098 domain-containing protein YvlB